MRRDVARLQACHADGDFKGRKLRAIHVLWTLPTSAHVSGVRRFLLLKRLNAVLCRTDLDTCLEACRHNPNLPEETTALLCEALSIPALQTPEPETITKLRDDASHGFQLDANSRSAWRDTMLIARPLSRPPLSFRTLPEALFHRQLRCRPGQAAV